MGGKNLLNFCLAFPLGLLELLMVPSKVVQKARLSLVFSTLFSVFGNCLKRSNECFIKCVKVGSNFESGRTSSNASTWTKHTFPVVPVVLFIMLYKVTLKALEETPNCDYSEAVFLTFTSGKSRSQILVNPSAEQETTLCGKAWKRTYK